MKVNQKVLLKHRQEYLIHTPDYLRKFFACILPKILKGRHQAPKHCAYPYEGDGVFGCVSCDTPGTYEFTYRGNFDMERDLYLRVSVEEMQDIATGKKAFLRLWRCTLPECDHSLHAKDYTCVHCGEKCRRATWTKKQVSAEHRREKRFRKWMIESIGAAGNQEEEVEVRRPKYPVKSIVYPEFPSIGMLVDLGRKKCASLINSIDSCDGKPVRFLNLDKTSQNLSIGICGVSLTFPSRRISVGEFAWEIANVAVSWGTQNRLKHAPERPIPGIRDYWLHSLALHSNGWWWEPLVYGPTQIPTPDDFDPLVVMGLKDRQKANP